MDNNYRISLIDDMVWSYSRLSAFGMCKNQWYLHYLEYPDQPESQLFFSQYGSFVHDILARYFASEISAQDAVRKYLIGFTSNVYARAPNSKIFNTYYQDGLAYLKHLPPVPKKVIAVEKEVEFELPNVDKPISCVGFIDLVYEDEDGLTIMDHKSRTLKPFSNRKKPTASDETNREYLRQLYLYGFAWKQITGKPPDQLQVNSFRNQTVITEPYSQAYEDEAVQWATQRFLDIRTEQQYPADIDWFKCRYLCGMHNYCDLYEFV